jgi:hypothetical protein
MAPHDAIFLHAERDWFEEYRTRFASHAPRLQTDPFIHGIYQHAQARVRSGK